MAMRKSDIVVSLVTLVVGVLTIGTYLYLDNLSNSREHPGKVIITNPAPKEVERPRVVRVSGSSEVPQGVDRQLWIIVRTSAGGYFPQGKANERGEWTCVITLGSQAPEDDGDYHIIAALANGEESQKFREYVNSELPVDRHGMNDYPAAELDVKQTVVVHRNIALRPEVQKKATGTCK